MKNIHGDYLKILGLVHYDERIINNMMVLTTRGTMKELLMALIFSFVSGQILACEERVIVSETCTISVSATKFSQRIRLSELLEKKGFVVMEGGNTEFSLKTYTRKHLDNGIIYQYQLDYQSAAGKIIGELGIMVDVIWRDIKSKTVGNYVWITDLDVKDSSEKPVCRSRSISFQKSLHKNDLEALIPSCKLSK